MVAPYQRPSLKAGSWQLCDTLIPYVALWYLMYLSRSVSWWITLPLAVVAGAFAIRSFIIFHDCGHGSFFKSQLANHIWGCITGLITFTPYFNWRWEHGIHHATSGNLDKRGTGDVWTLTVQEYLSSSRWTRFRYRVARNPLVLMGISPFLLLLLSHRIPRLKSAPREFFSVLLTNLAMFGIGFGLSRVFGLKEYLIIQFTVLAVAYVTGVWLFYVQHQFDGVYWERKSHWDFADAALKGSSYYRLPKVLQWFSGNIGFHHIHHLSARIPNYHLARCHQEIPLFQSVKEVTLRSSLKSIRYRLWDEDKKNLVGYDQLSQHLRRSRN